MQRALLLAIAAVLAAPATSHAQTTEVDVEVTVIDVQVTTTAPAPTAPEAPTADDGISPILRTRGELLMVGGDYHFAAWGGSALIGARLHDGFAGGLVVGYLSELGDGPAEVDLALEVEKDFSPLESMGLVLLARLGTAFMLDDGDPQHEGIRLVGELGVGGRIDVAPKVAITLDLRGVLRYRPGTDLVGSARDHVAGGAAFTIGLLFALD